MIALTQFDSFRDSDVCFLAIFAILQGHSGHTAHVSYIGTAKVLLARSWRFSARFGYFSSLSIWSL